jgi:sugar/nucleoside kinase (ribokinase family)
MTDPTRSLLRIQYTPRVTKCKCFKVSKQRNRASKPAASCFSSHSPPSLHPQAIAFTLILDDLVFPDGHTRMAQLGGGGPQTLWAYQAFHAGQTAVGLAAGIGRDLPDGCLQWLTANGIDTSGLIVDHHQTPTPRAWQILENDGRRHEIWRTKQTPEQAEMLLPSVRSLPSSFRLAGCSAYHLGIHPEHPPLKLLQELRGLCGDTGSPALLSAETFTAARVPVPHSALRAYLSLLDIFSPNEMEATSILGFEDGAYQPKELITALFDVVGDAARPRWVAMRRGDKGALVAERTAGKGEMRVWNVDAVKTTNVVDTTGCGNAFCGAFLAALQSRLATPEAGAIAVSAGSLMAEVEGVPDVIAAEMTDELLKRAKLVAMREL